ncbi:MAG: FAD-dependent oxidoreductase [Steroidobacteraceae bacterium]
MAGRSSRLRDVLAQRRRSSASIAPLNDVHSRLNASRPALTRRPNSVEEVRAALLQARRRGLTVAIAGGRHAMGGQQFIEGGCVLDLRGLNRILDFDRERGLITVQAGATWPELMRGYLSLQVGNLLRGASAKNKRAPISSQLAARWPPTSMAGV